MDFTFNEEQTLIQDQVDQFVQKEYDWETRQSLSNSDLGFGFRAVSDEVVAYSHSNEISKNSLKYGFILSVI